MVTNKYPIQLIGIVALLLTISGLPVLADKKADRLIQEITAASKSAKSLTADLSLSQKAGAREMKLTGKAKLKKPNLALVTVAGTGLSQTISSNGKSVITLMPGNQYMKSPADPNGKNIDVMWAFPINMFFDPKSANTNTGEGRMTYAGKQMIGGKSYEVLEKKGDGQTFRFFVDGNKMVTRTTIDIKQGEQSVTLSAELANIKANAPLATEDMAYKLPRTAKLYEQPNFDAKLIPVGKLAEKFDLISLKGDRITRDEAAKGKKAVLVNFWFYG